jgi:hypothetical protein
MSHWRRQYGLRAASQESHAIRSISWCSRGFASSDSQTSLSKKDEPLGERASQSASDLVTFRTPTKLASSERTRLASQRRGDGCPGTPKTVSHLLVLTQGNGRPSGAYVLLRRALSVRQYPSRRSEISDNKSTDGAEAPPVEAKDSSRWAGRLPDCRRPALSPCQQILRGS